MATQLFVVEAANEPVLKPFASALVQAMMKSYPLEALFCGDLLVPFGALRQAVGLGYFLEGNLHAVRNVGPWRQTVATFRINIATGGTVLDRVTILNAWFDFDIFGEGYSNFRASTLNISELARLARDGPELVWNFGSQSGDLRF